VEEDEEALDAQDLFEAKYNFRFEEPGSTRIVPHPRIQEETVRKDKSKRKRERAAKKERVEEETKAKREQLMRLKALKRAELDKKLQLIRQVAGKDDLQLEAEDIEEEFDATKHEQRMAEVFGSEYYEEEDALDGEEIEKPQFDDLEEELAQVMGANSQGFDSTRRKNRKKQQHLSDDENEEGEDEVEEEEEEEKEEEEDINESEDDEEDGEDDANDDLDKEEEEEELGEGARQRMGKRAAKRLRKEVEKHIDEYYKLDYEGLAAGLPCRFKYRQVNPKKYKLSTESILSLPDKELNQVISLKKLAPYRDGRYDKFNPLGSSQSQAPHKAESASYSRPNKQNNPSRPSKQNSTREQNEQSHDQVQAPTVTPKPAHKDDANAELLASRLLSYELPKIGKSRSTTAVPQKKRKTKH